MKTTTGGWGLLAVSLALVLGAANGTEGGGAQRPFLVLAHSAQSVVPHKPTTDHLDAFVLLDQKTRCLSFTVGNAAPDLVWSLRGPAPPGKSGAEIASGSWSPTGNDVGPLSKSQVRALNRGLLYLEFVQPSALPEPPLAMRGQLLPIQGVRYPAP